MFLCSRLSRPSGRRLLLVSAALAAASRSRGGQDADHLRATEPTSTPRTPSTRSRRRARRRVLLPRDADRFRAVRRPGRAVRRRCLRRLGLQGERRLAPRRRRPGDARERRPRPLVLRGVRAEGGPPTLFLKKATRGCYAATAFDDNHRAIAVAGLALRVGSKRTVAFRNGQACPGPHRGLLSAPSRSAPFARTPVVCTPRRPPARARRRRVRRRRRGRAGDGDALGDARPRRACPLEGTVPAGLTAMQALDRKLDVDTRYGGRFVQAIEGSRATRGPNATGSSSSTGSRATGARPR